MGKNKLMDYPIIWKHLNPYWINNKQNLNRIVNFINHFQWGLPYDYDDSCKDDDEDDHEDYDIDLDKTADDLSVENDIKELIDLTSSWDGTITHYYGDGEVFKLTGRM